MIPHVTPSIDAILGRLEQVRRSGSGWSARCPAHEDRNSSLSVGAGEDGRILLHCFAGCGAEAVAGALGLAMRNLFPTGERAAPPSTDGRLTVERLAAAKRLPADFLRSLGVADRPFGVEIPYLLADGSLAPRQRIRTALAARDGSLWSRGAGRPVPYGLWRLAEARSAGRLVIVEGESDCWTCWFHGLPALGIPGASMTGVLDAAHLTGIPLIFAVQETDEAGARFVRDIARRLAAIDWNGDARLLEMFDGTKDINDLHRQAGAGEFMPLLKNLMDEAAKIGIPQDLVRSAAEAATSAGPGDTWDPPSPFFTANLPPFPVDALPGWLADFVRAEAVATQVLPDLPGMIALAVVAVACALKIVIVIKRGHIEPLNLFVVVALASGNRKSQNFRDLVRVIEEFEGVLLKRVEPEIQAAETRRRIAVRRLELIEYSSNGDANFGVFLRGHAGDPLRVDRISRPSDIVDRPALTVALAVQPHVIRGLALTPGFRGKGLLARFLYAIPASLLGRRDTEPPPVPDPIRAAYRARVLKLLELPFATDETGQRVAWELHLDDEANGEMRAFARWLEPRLGETGEFGAMPDWAGKLVGAVGRIAGGLHMAEHAQAPRPWEISVGVHTIRNAIRIGKYLTEHARAAFSEMGADPAVEDARYLLRWIERKGVTTFSRSEAYQDARRRFRRVDDMDPPLSILINHGYVRELPPARSAGPGRKPSPPLRGQPACRAGGIDGFPGFQVRPGGSGAERR